MAKFQGTVQEFHDYLGPKIRNMINTITISARKKLAGRCQICGEKFNELESAHVHGCERREIIEKILIDYQLQDGSVNGDIKEIIEKIKKAHNPIEKTFLFLCAKCHRKYDKNGLPDRSLPPNLPQEPNPEFIKIDRIELWAQKPDQINHKIISAYLSLETTDMKHVQFHALEEKCSKIGIKKFYGNFRSMTTDKGNSHGKVFYEEENYIKIYPQVRKEINKYLDNWSKM